MPCGGSVDDPNEILREEHEAIELLLTAMDGIADRIRKKDQVPEGDLEKAFTVVSEFADKCHHAKEEKVLFPVLSKASKEGAEISRRLTSDHVAFRHLVGNTRALVPKAQEDKVARSHLVKNLDTYTHLLREHIAIETSDLFREVERAIPPEAREELAEAFERVEREEIGAGVHEKYHAMIHGLAHAYAP